MNYRTVILQSGNNTGIEVPDEVVTALGAGKKPPVHITLNGGYSYRSTIASMGGTFMIPFSSDHRRASGIAGGDAVDVELTLDTEPRKVTVPDDLAAALQDDPPALAFWNSLSYSNQRRQVLQIEGAKTAETRQRRIDKTLADVRAGKK